MDGIQYYVWYTKLHDLVAAAASARVPLWHRDREMPHQRTRRGVEARLAPRARGVPLQGGVTAFCWGSRFGARLRLGCCVLRTTAPHAPATPPGLGSGSVPTTALRKLYE